MKKALQSAIMLLLAFAVSASASPAPCAAGQRWLFGGKEREHAGGRNSFDFGARILIPAGSWSSADPLAHKFYPLSPFSYCGGDPINYVDPDGMRPIYSLEGDFLGTDDNGLTGEPWIMDVEKFKDSMSPKDAKSVSVDISSLSGYIQEKNKVHSNHFKERPDYDGYITLEEANEWYRQGTGRPLYADLRQIDLSGVAEAIDTHKKEDQLLSIFNQRNSINEMLVYGTITIYVISESEIRAKPDTYDFDMQKGLSLKVGFRNSLTVCGEIVAKRLCTRAKPYQIIFYGTGKIK